MKASKVYFWLGIFSALTGFIFGFLLEDVIPLIVLGASFCYCNIMSEIYSVKEFLREEPKDPLGELL